MQRRAAAARRCAVDRIAEDRPAHFGAMHAKLMRASGQRLEREPGQRSLRWARGPAPSTWSPPAGRCGSCFIHQPRVSSRRPSGRSIVPSSASGRAFDHGPIGLVDRAVLEQLAELRQRLAMAAEHQAAGGVAVEPVRQRRRAAAARSAARRNGLRRLVAAVWGRGARRSRPACRSPASARRDRAAATPSLPGSCLRASCRNRYHGRRMQRQRYRA